MLVGSAACVCVAPAIAVCVVLMLLVGTAVDVLVGAADAVCVAPAIAVCVVLMLLVGTAVDVLLLLGVADGDPVGVGDATVTRAKLAVAVLPAASEALKVAVPGAVPVTTKLAVIPPLTSEVTACVVVTAPPATPVCGVTS